MSKYIDIMDDARMLMTVYKLGHIRRRIDLLVERRILDHDKSTRGELLMLKGWRTQICKAMPHPTPIDRTFIIINDKWELPDDDGSVPDLMDLSFIDLAPALMHDRHRGYIQKWRAKRGKPPGDIDESCAQSRDLTARYLLYKDVLRKSKLYQSVPLKVVV